jgi:hypothetical protein
MIRGERGEVAGKGLFGLWQFGEAGWRYRE